MPSGQFRIRATSHYKSGSPAVEDSSPFATTHVLHSHGFFADAKVQNMLELALAYLRREMTGAGLWCDWNRDAFWKGRRIRR